MQFTSNNEVKFSKEVNLVDQLIDTTIEFLPVFICLYLIYTMLGIYVSNIYTMLFKKTAIISR